MCEAIAFSILVYLASFMLFYTIRCEFAQWAEKRATRRALSRGEKAHLIYRIAYGVFLSLMIIGVYTATANVGKH